MRLEVCWQAQAKSSDIAIAMPIFKARRETDGIRIPPARGCESALSPLLEELRVRTANAGWRGSRRPKCVFVRNAIRRTARSGV